MIEFVQQNNLGPSPFHDIYAEDSGLQGLHHLAIFVDDLKQEIKNYNEQGIETALYAETKTGTAFAMMDISRTTSHMLELYEPSDTLVGFYTMVADAAKNFDGNNPIRELSA